jgi:hypothetical protein
VTFALDNPTLREDFQAAVGVTNATAEATGFERHIQSKTWIADV